VSCPAPSLPDCFGPYRVTGLLGEGGGGVVYAAERDGVGTSLALKVPHPDQPLTVRERQRFLEEVRMMARVAHPAIVEVVDAGLFEDGTPYMVMPRLVGRTLAQRIAKDGRLSMDRALELFEQLADALSSLHEAGLVHRDLKPENVFLIESDTRAKLLDFGIAKDRSAPQISTTTGVVRGTPATMAPERFLGAAATEASDVYELAVVLYVMLVGRLPWDDDTDLDARLKPRTPIEAGVPLPAALAAELMCALSTRPHLRPPSAHDFAERILAAALSEAPTESIPVLRTVTCENLRPWTANPTPLDAALSSNTSAAPSSADTLRSARRKVGRFMAPAMVGVVVGIIAYAAFAYRTSTSETLSVRLAPSAPVLSTHESAPAAQAPAAHEPTSVDVPGEEQERKRRVRRAPLSGPKPATSAAPGDKPANEAAAPIPGGVYETPPY
jgi:eukaryotic-like serine/threonine-protein kinase